MKGKGEFHFQDKTYPIRAGQGFLITPNLSATYCADAEDPWEYYWVGFNGIEARNMLEKAKLSEEDVYKRQFRALPFKVPKLVLVQEIAGIIITSLTL